MTEGDLSPGSATVAEWCYEYASEGIAYHQWPALVAARSLTPSPRTPPPPAPTPEPGATPSRRASPTRIPS